MPCSTSVCRAAPVPCRAAPPLPRLSSSRSFVSLPCRADHPRPLPPLLHSTASSLQGGTSCQGGRYVSRAARNAQAVITMGQSHRVCITVAAHYAGGTVQGAGDCTRVCALTRSGEAVTTPEQTVIILVSARTFRNVTLFRPTVFQRTRSGRSGDGSLRAMLCVGSGGKWHTHALDEKLVQLAAPGHRPGLHTQTPAASGHVTLQRSTTSPTNVSSQSGLSLAPWGSRRAPRVTLCFQTGERGSLCLARHHVSHRLRCLHVMSPLRSVAFRIHKCRVCLVCS